jgi:hypothetical protein
MVGRAYVVAGMCGPVRMVLKVDSNKLGTDLGRDGEIVGLADVVKESTGVLHRLLKNCIICL